MDADKADFLRSHRGALSYFSPGYFSGNGRNCIEESITPALGSTATEAEVICVNLQLVSP